MNGVALQSIAFNSDAGKGQQRYDHAFVLAEEPQSAPRRNDDRGMILSAPIMPDVGMHPSGHRIDVRGFLSVRHPKAPYGAIVVCVAASLEIISEIEYRHIGPPCCWRPVF